MKGYLLIVQDTSRAREDPKFRKSLQRASLIYSSAVYSDEGAMEYIDAFGTDVFDASSILIKLSGLVLFWLEPGLLPCCWPIDAMNWLRKLSAELAAGWLVVGAFALEAVLPLTGARPWLKLGREFIITPDLLHLRSHENALKMRGKGRIDHGWVPNFCR
jgi:hypothetical protein